jgi:hypothetical protein
MNSGRGGKRKGAGRPRGQGRFGEETVSVRIPRTLLSEVEKLLVEQAAKSRPLLKPPSKQILSLRDKIASGLAAKDVVALRADALDLLAACAALPAPPTIVHLDPWYWIQRRGKPASDIRFWEQLIEASRLFADHIFVWGTWKFLFQILPSIPAEFEARNCIVWHFQNAPSRGGGWRTSHNHCLHIVKKTVKTSALNFLNEAQLERHRTGGLRFVPAPPDTIIAPLEIGYINRRAQTDHPAQKPSKVIHQLLKMVATPGALVVDPTAGSGTAGEVALQLGMRAILGDHSADYLRIIQSRLHIKAPAR